MCAAGHVCRRATVRQQGYEVSSRVNMIPDSDITTNIRGIYFLISDNSGYRFSQMGQIIAAYTSQSEKTLFPSLGPSSRFSAFWSTVPKYIIKFGQFLVRKRGWSLREKGKNKIISGTQPKAQAGWPKRLRLVQATPWADFAVLDVQLCSNITAIFPEVDSFAFNYYSRPRF